MVMMVKRYKECLLTQPVNVRCGRPTMVCNHMIINHEESTECNFFNLLLLKSI